MARVGPVTSIVLLMSTLVAAMPAAAMAVYKWRHRPVVVFAPSDSHPMLAQQRRIVADATQGFAERHIAIVWVVADTVTAQMGPPPGMTAAALRRRFGVAPIAFKAVLVGKDGGTKLSQDGPVTSNTLFQTIDAMPMRRDEMRRR